MHTEQVDAFASYRAGEGRTAASGWGMPGRGRGKGIGRGGRGAGGVDFTACGHDVVSCDPNDDSAARCLERCANEEDSALPMSFVGDGKGDYIQEIVYRFVGAGDGAFVDETPRKRIDTSYCAVAAAGVGCAVVLVAAILVCLPPIPMEPAGQIWPSDISYNCQLDYAMWEQNWPTGKKSWCCMHTGLACEPGLRRPTAGESLHHLLQPPNRWLQL